MGWVLVITCAAGISCGLKEPVVKFGLLDGVNCEDVAKLGLALFEGKVGTPPEAFQYGCAELHAPGTKIAPNPK